MKSLLLLSLLAFAVVADYEYDGDVMVLTEETFDQAFNEFDYLMFEFYAPWCGHCKELAPKYAEAATALRPEGIVLAKIDATVQKKLAEKYGVKGYPTIKFSAKQAVKDFEGGRNADGIKNWIYSNLNPESELLDTLEQVNEAIAQNNVQFVYFAEEQSEKDRELRKYKEFSFTMKQHFAHTTNKTIREALNVPKGTYFVGFRNQKPYYYQGKLSFPIMKTFVENVAHERIQEYSDKKEQLDERITKSKPFVVVFSDEPEVQAAAQAWSYQDELLFIKNVDEEFTRKIQVRSQDQKGVFIIKGDQRYKRVQGQSVSEFLEAFQSGNAHKYLKSQAAPQQQGLVRILIGDTYEATRSVNDSVVLYFDSQNEEHNAVQEQFLKVAERLQQNKQLTFHKIDLSQNEVSDLAESVEIVKIRLYKNNQPIKFVIRANKIQEERFVKWIVDNAASQVVDPKVEL
ncbi:unnamed protein product (macronuclear) [Paramecium tetraurelia]|uniref:Thioredoxin domain-containing protein n=1 Tax=Paramecium tetraurelia TaxID=5888 RepID=A0BR04_PARTE|nr:uncharacterized protein GSPATT00031200001 [Paramecium tetraurelia]CAK60971.1 unnamed protein product [Paramecium tetraurelia]|eukprot:XP_001428369.1 hypothetical protein (macronuclear) [Paramecium tetraurelia strain d4-2]